MNRKREGYKARNPQGKVEELIYTQVYETELRTSAHGFGPPCTQRTGREGPHLLTPSRLHMYTQTHTSPRFSPLYIYVYALFLFFLNLNGKNEREKEEKKRRSEIIELFLYSRPEVASMEGGKYLNKHGRLFRQVWL